MRARFPCAALLVASLAAASAAAAPLPEIAEELTHKNFKRLLRRIAPKPGELVWDAVPWRETLWQAVTEAQERDRPILLWAMNGHPLGHT